MTINGKRVKEQTEQKSLPVIHKNMNGRAVFIPVALFSMLSLKDESRGGRGDPGQYKYCDLFFPKVKTHPRPLYNN